MRQAIRIRFLESLLVAASILVAFVLLEGGSRIYFGIRLFDDRNYASEKIYSSSLAVEGVYHPILGWTFPRNPSNNPLGLLPRIAVAPEPRPGETVLAVGDSFVTGYASEERWSTQLESLLNVAVLNGATGGWGIDQTFLRVKELVPLLKPAVVIFGFIPDDLRRAELSVFFGSPKPYFSIAGGKLVLQGTPVLPYEPSARHIGWFRKIFGHSYALHRLALALGLQHRWLAGAAELRYAPDRPDSVAIGCLIARELRAMKEAGTVRDVIVFPQYSYTDLWPVGDQVRSVEKFEKLIRCAAALGLEVVDPRSFLIERVESHPGGRIAAFQTYWGHPSDPHHWAPGDRLMAEFIAPFVARALGRAPAAHVRGAALAQVEKHKDALALYDEALNAESPDATRAPDFIRAQAFFLRARSRGALGDVRGALDDYTAAIGLHPANTLFRLARATLRNASGDADSARDDVRAAYAVQPASPFIQEHMTALGLESEITAKVPRIRRFPQQAGY